MHKFVYSRFVTHISHPHHKNKFDTLFFSFFFDFIFLMLLPLSNKFEFDANKFPTSTMPKYVYCVICECAILYCAW